jgi:adenylate kinase
LRDLIGITGTPGTGKKSIAPLLARELRMPAIALNDYVQHRGLAVSSKGTLIVDTDRLRASLLKRLTRPCVVYGHLLSDVIRRGEVRRVFVLRCEPSELKKRLVPRDYSGKKLRDNLEAELIGVLLSSAIETYGDARVTEVDTTESSPSAAAMKMLALVDVESRKEKRIDWTLAYASAEKLVSLFPAVSTGSALT